MNWIAGIIIGLYGLASIVGGLIGYLSAGSKASIAAGGTLGLLLVICAIGQFIHRPVPWLIGAIVVSLFLAAFFGRKLVPNLGRLAEFWHEPAGPRSIVMFAGAVLVIVVAAIAMAGKSST
jgi:uncharacterized membrane protein (UPF0136 family)